MFRFAVILAAVLLLSPGLALLVVGIGVGAAQVVQRRWWVEFLFNLAQLMILAAAGAAGLAAIGWGNGAARSSHIRQPWR